jgi:CRP/FNR family transcriptional regulator
LWVKDALYLLSGREIVTSGPSSGAKFPSWIVDFPRFAGLGQEVLSRLFDHSRLLALGASQTVFAPGEICRHYILVREGTARVSLADAEGQSIVLYRLGPGDGCVLTTAAVLSAVPYAAIAVAETGIEAVLIERSAFLHLLATCDDFRRAALSDHGQRIIDLMTVVGNLAFESLDHRLAKRLRQLSAEQSELRVTHEALATELGTAREVISRRLKEFERRGWLQGKVEILEKMAASLPVKP